MGYRVYPVTQTELFCRDYTVLIDGKEVPLNSARVSAVPFNRYWPGHQRQIEQTELINFLSFSLDAPVTLEIVPHKPFERVELRPASAELGYEITGEGHIVVTLKNPQYFTVEPYGRNHALHVFADPMPQYDIDQNDPNLLYFGAGEHDVGLIELKSNQTLYLDEGQWSMRGSLPSGQRISVFWAEVFWTTAAARRRSCLKQLQKLKRSTYRMPFGIMR